ncbi:MAG: hypothetical protein SCK28_01055 [Bacillota bacterium]|nr:hypothetical protein [Bacillota bacterium]
MLLLIGLALSGIGVIALIEGAPLYQKKKWLELAVIGLVLAVAGVLGIAQIIGVELGAPLKRLIDVLPSFLEPVLQVLLTN